MGLISTAKTVRGRRNVFVNALRASAFAMGAAMASSTGTLLANRIHQVPALSGLSLSVNRYGCASIQTPSVREDHLVLT